MCLLTVFAPEGVFDETAMENAAWRNPDGFGFALVLGTHIARFRSMDYDETAEEFMRLRSEHPDAWALFHHRFSTGGGETADNCHPFTWGHDDRLAVAHNGVLPIPATRDKSDTRLWAENHLANVDPAYLDDDDWCDATERWLGSSKAVVLSTHSANKYWVYILNERLGDWCDGVWYSNDSWKPVRHYERSWYSTSADPFAASRFEFGSATDNSGSVYDQAKCVTCDETWNMRHWLTDRMCPTCDTCWYCEQYYLACECEDEVWADEEQEVRALPPATEILSPETMRHIAAESLRDAR